MESNFHALVFLSLLNSLQKKDKLLDTTRILCLFPTRLNMRIHVRASIHCTLYVDISYLAGQGSSAAINCPYVILGPYSFTVTANTVSTCDSPNSSWDMCTDTSQMTFNRITCPDTIAFSGKLYRPNDNTTIIVFIYSSTTISKQWPLILSMHLCSLSFHSDET